MLKYQSLNNRERLFLWLALAVAVLLLLSNGLPALTSYYQQRAAAIEQLRDDIAREQRLIEDAEQWAQRRQQTEQQRPNLSSQVIEGSSTPLLTAAIQRQVRQIASQTGVTITSASLAEAQEHNGWLKVEQTMAFATTDQQSILRMLLALEQAEPFLGVNGLTLRRTRNQLTGELTVVGFSRTDGRRS